LFDQPKLGLFDILVALVIFQYLLIAGFLLTHRPPPGRTAANSLLATFFVLIALNLADGVLMMKGFYLFVPSLALLEDSLVLTYGPILYLYTLKIVLPERKLSSKDLFHFIPWLILFIVIFFFYSVKDDSEKRVIITLIMGQSLPAFYGMLLSSVLFIHFFIYLFIAFIQIRTFHLSLHDRYSSLATVNVSWLEFTLRTVGITFVLSWLVTSLSILGESSLAQGGLVVVVGILFYYINRLVLKALKDPRLFSSIDVSVRAKRYSRQPIESSELDDIRTRLNEAMATDKLFADSELTVDSLSDKVSLPPRKLSQFLNETLKKSFFDYVNELRVEEAKRILEESDDRGLTVQEVMYKVGLNSKSSFNTLFRQKTGVTPGMYRKMHSGS
jgi:AraC-like DNA-binding protein